MIIATANEKKSVRVRFLADAPDEAECLAGMAKDIFKRITVTEESSDKTPSAIVSYTDNNEILIQLPKWACITVRDADQIKKTQWGVNRVKMKMKVKGQDDLTVHFWFRKEVRV